ncbi:MAG: sugar kinase [Pyrinomonadaceae bacterium]
MSSRGKFNEVVVIGELNVDLVASGLKSEPILGHEIVADNFNMTLGSASAIFSCGIARLGRGVTFVSRIGSDEFGEFCVAALSRKGVSTERILVRGESRTGVTVVMSTPNDRALVTYLGAIAELEFADIPVDVLDGHRHLHMSSYYLQTALQPDFGRLMAEAKQKGLTASFDPNSDPDQARNEKIFEVIKHTDILFLNEPEAKLLTMQNDVRSACERLGRFCPLVVVKLGGHGAIAYRNREFVTANGFRVDAVDTTGAGDSFAAGFVHAFLDNRELKECLMIGNACGALSATKPGGTGGQPSLAELSDFVGKSATSA